METSIGRYQFLWKLLRIFSIGWFLVTLATITSVFPSQLVLFAIIGFLFAALLGTITIATGNWNWALSALAVSGLLFLIAVLVQATTGVAELYLPITLLQFLMLLFEVEVLTLICKHHSLFSKGLPRPEAFASVSVLEKSAQQILGHLSRLALLFSSSYLISLGILYVGAQLSSLSFMLSDISIFVVVVSISLALLLVLREDQR